VPETRIAEEQTVEGWLTTAYDYHRPRRGELRVGEILKVEDHGVTVDVGLKRDGFVPRTDLDRLEEEATNELEPGQEIVARIVKPEDREGNLVLSMYQARQEKDWDRAEQFLDNEKVWRGEVADSNKGGLLVNFGHIRGFVPASHLSTWDGQRLPTNEREAKLAEYLGQELPLKVIEVKRNRRRLILSERLARRQMRGQNMDRMLNELVEGMVVPGKVTRLANFGAFVDLGGAEGLIHISELAWRRIDHPSQVIHVGDEVDAYILRLDHKRKRIGLSLRRLQPNPWTLVDETYSVDQLVSGTVTNVVDFGAFVALPLGIEGLLHISEIADPTPEDPREFVQPGDELVLRILRIDSFRQRMALSLKEVSEEEREAWLSGQVSETDTPDDTSAHSEEVSPSPAFEHEVELDGSDTSEHVTVENLDDTSPYVLGSQLAESEVN
jgi:small subunit ribosomal protein S1